MYLDRHRIKWWIESPSTEWGVLKEKILWAIARALPGPIRYLATVVSCGEATMGQWGNEHPDQVSMMTMLKRIERHAPKLS